MRRKRQELWFVDPCEQSRSPKIGQVTISTIVKSYNSTSTCVVSNLHPTHTHTHTFSTRHQHALQHTHFDGSHTRTCRRQALAELLRLLFVSLMLIIFSIQNQSPNTAQWFISHTNPSSRKPQKHDIVKIPTQASAHSTHQQHINTVAVGGGESGDSRNSGLKR